MLSQNRIYSSIHSRIENIPSGKKEIIFNVAQEALMGTSSDTAEYQLICELVNLILDSSLPLRDDFKVSSFRDYVSEVISTFIEDGNTDNKTIESLISISRKYRGAWYKELKRHEDFQQLSDFSAYKSYKEQDEEDEEKELVNELESNPVCVEDNQKQGEELPLYDFSLDNKIHWIKALIDIHSEFKDESRSLDSFAENVKRYLIGVPLSLKARAALTNSIHTYLVHECTSGHKNRSYRSSLYIVSELAYTIMYMAHSYKIDVEEMFVKRNVSRKFMFEWAKVRMALKKFLAGRFANDPYIDFVVLPVKIKLPNFIRFDYLYTNSDYKSLLKYCESIL